jgi:hypothetical protein
VEHRIVVNDDDTVTGCVHIELDGVGPQFDRSLEGS